jgi:ATP-dependent Lhr-like helicase
VPVAWFESLAEQGRALYVEPGLWIAAEHEAEYASAFGNAECKMQNAGMTIQE